MKLSGPEFSHPNFMDDSNHEPRGRSFVFDDRPEGDPLDAAVRPVLLRAPQPDVWCKVRRLIWTVVWALLYRWSPVPLHSWRRLLLRAFGAAVGKRAHPYPTSRIWAPWNLTMGDRSCLGPGVDCYSTASVVLRADAVVSQKTYLCTAGHDIREPKFPLVVGAITIEEGAWVAADAFIGPGVTIGQEAVVGARACVFRDVPARAVVGGNPARFLKWRVIREDASEKR